jgi:hypothetical protein
MAARGQDCRGGASDSPPCAVVLSCSGCALRELRSRPEQRAVNTGNGRPKRQHHRHLKLALEDIQNFRDNSRKTKDVEATTQPIQREIYCD